MLYIQLYIGTYSRALNKMVYIESRRFLLVSSSLRRDKRNFHSKLKEFHPLPKPRTYDEIKDNHVAYDNAKYKL